MRSLGGRSTAGVRLEEAQPRKNVAQNRSEGDKPLECGERRHNLGGTVHEIAWRAINRRSAARGGTTSEEQCMKSLGE